MALFAWSDGYSVNIMEIDNQHKRLIELINELHSAMAAGKGKEVLGKTLQGLIDYTKTHFAYEENLMKTHGYSEYSQHKTAHEKLVSQVLDFQKKFQAGEMLVTIDIMNFLKDWLSKHIMGTDKKYSPFFNSKGIV